jgi:hypothetical protein
MWGTLPQSNKRSLPSEGDAVLSSARIPCERAPLQRFQRLEAVPLQGGSIDGGLLSALGQVSDVVCPQLVIRGIGTICARAEPPTELHRSESSRLRSLVAVATRISLPELAEHSATPP